MTTNRAALPREAIFKHLIELRYDIKALNQDVATYLHDMLVMELMSPLDDDEKLSFLDTVERKGS